MDATSIQEFQRLNESITLCIDSVRRLLPQLAQVQQTVAQLTLPFHAQGLGVYPQTGVPYSPWAQQGTGAPPFYGANQNIGPGGVGGLGYGAPVSPFAQTMSPFAQTMSPFGAAQPWQMPFANPYVPGRV